MSDEPTGIEAQVCRDIAARQRLGLRKYGVSVEGNPLSLEEWLTAQYEELLDAAIYCKRAMSELTPKLATCRECLGDGFVEIQSGPYTRSCHRCNGTGKEKQIAQNQS